MSFNPGFTSGGGGAEEEESESEIDEASTDAFRRSERGSLAEPEVEEETTQMQEAQDRDLQEVQRREQQATEADTSTQSTTSGSSGGFTRRTGGGGGGTTTAPEPEPEPQPEPEPTSVDPGFTSGSGAVSSEPAPPEPPEPAAVEAPGDAADAADDSAPPADTSPDPGPVEAPTEDTAGTTTPSDAAGGAGQDDTTGGGADTKTIVVIKPDGTEETRTVDADRDIASTVIELPSGELVGASAPGQAAGETRDPTAGGGTTGTLVSTGTVSGQGVETGGPGSGGQVQAEIDGETISGSVQEVATAAEQDFLEDNPEFTKEDVRVVVDENQLAFEFTQSGQEVVEQRQQAEAAESIEDSLQAGAAELTGNTGGVKTPALDRVALGTGIDVDLTAADIEQADGGFTLTEEATDRIVTLIDEQQATPIDQEVQAAQLSGAAAAASAQPQKTERAKEIQAAQLSGAAAAASAAPNKIERRLEAQIEEQTGRDVDLVRKDFEIIDEEGARSVELTQSGVDKIATQPLTDTVPEGIGTRSIEVVPGPFAGKFPGSGLIGAGLEFGEKEPIGPIAKDIGVTRDFGDIDVQVAQFGERGVTPGRGVAPRERTGTKSFETILDELDADVAGAVEPQTPAVQVGDVRPGRAGGGKQTERRAFTGTGQEAAAAFGEATIESIPRFAIGAAKLGKDAADFTVEVGETELQELDTLFTSVGQVGINTAGVGISEGIEAPGVTAGRVAGSLIGSGAIFGAASAVGPRTSLAARAAIQPGEEIAGIGGFAATKRLAGAGTAQRFFPNKEPLIFSEEAFIRAVRGTSSRVSRRFEAADFESRFEDVDVRQSTLDAIDRAQTRFAQVDPRGGREPRLLAEGPIVASGPRAVGRGNLGEGEFVIRPRGEAGPTDVEAPTVEDEIDGDGEDGMSVGGGDFTIEVEAEEGRVLQQDIRRADVENRLDAPSEAEFERARSDPAFETRRRFETATEFDPIGRVGVEPIEAPGVEQFGGTEFFTEFDQPLAEVVRPDVFQEFDQEFKPPAEVELEREIGEVELERLGTPTDIRTELFLEQRLDEEQELEIEQELENEFGEIEAEMGGKDRTREDRADRDEDFGTFERLLRFERTEDPFGEIDADLDAIDEELLDFE